MLVDFGIGLQYDCSLRAVKANFKKRRTSREINGYTQFLLVKMTITYNIDYITVFFYKRNEIPEYFLFVIDNIKIRNNSQYKNIAVKNKNKCLYATIVP